MFENRIGILFNSNFLRRLIHGKTTYEAISSYENAARQNGLIPCFFRLQDVNVRKREVIAYIKRRSGYVRRRMPIPRVVHNRAIYMRSALHRRIRSLVKSNVTLFNQVNRYGKIDIHRLLVADPLVCPHLPETLIANKTTVRDMMKNHKALILKPNNSSVGRGIMKLEHTDNGWRTTYMRPTGKGIRKWRMMDTRAGTLPAIVRSRLANKKYLAQQMLPLACYKGRPFDLRVSVQRNGTGQWKVTGIIGKVAPPYTFLTNAAQGGTIYPFEHLALTSLPHIPVEELYNRLNYFSLLVANRLSDKLPQLADLGLDIGLSHGGMPLFIECNGRDQRYTFRKANLHDTWQATYTNPIAYGASLLKLLLNQRQRRA